MCTAVFAYGVHPTLLFLLAFNRDEFFDRAAEGVHSWNDKPGLVAPRDCERGGTWFGMTTKGRISFLTNIRVPRPKRSPRSRGMLPVEFATGDKSPSEFLKALDVQDYSPLNLFCGQLTGDTELAMFSSKAPDSPHVFKAGIHGISNGGLMDQNWHKVEKGKTALQDVLRTLAPDGDIPWAAIFDDVMGSSEVAAECLALPETGVEEWKERQFSAMRLRPLWNFSPPGGWYGTMSQIVVAVWKGGSVQIRERVWDLEQRHCDSELSFQLDIADGAAVV